MEEEIIKQLSKDISLNFIKSLELVCKGYEKEIEEEVNISETSLADAVDEIIKDLGFLISRRNSEVLTRGKLAGVILFRLSRWQIISTSNESLLEDRVFKVKFFDTALRCFELY